MGLSKAREVILKKVRQALTRPQPSVSEPNFTADVFSRSSEKDLSIVFAENFIKTKGEFIFCENEKEFALEFKKFVDAKKLENIFSWELEVEPLLLKSKVSFSRNEENFLEAQAGITLCEFLIARTGSLIVSSANFSGRRLGIYPPIHIVIAYSSQIKEDIKDGLAAVKRKYRESGLPSMIGLETGPSRTSDIEKTLVMGAHGPKELILFLIDDSSH